MAAHQRSSIPGSFLFMLPSCVLPMFLFPYCTPEQRPRFLLVLPCSIPGSFLPVLPCCLPGPFLLKRLYGWWSLVPSLCTPLAPPKAVSLLFKTTTLGGRGIPRLFCLPRSLSPPPPGPALSPPAARPCAVTSCRQALRCPSSRSSTCPACLHTQAHTHSARTVLYNGIQHPRPRMHMLVHTHTRMRSRTHTP